MSRLILIAAASYLLGSIPFGYLLVHVFRGEDVRLSGSGNIGATNVSRKSPLLGVLTLLLDALKGSAAVLIGVALSAPFLDRFSISIPPWRMIPPVVPDVATGAALAAFFAVIGHMFPIWLKFHGGKGVATGLGAFVMIAPKAVLMAAGIFLLVVLIFRYVSLASIAAVAAFPVLALLLHAYGGSRFTLAVMFITSGQIIGKHRANIRRLLAGTENRLGTPRLGSRHA